MPFPFSFVFSVPGIANPFTQAESLNSPRSPKPVQEDGRGHVHSDVQGPRKLKRGMNGNIFKSVKTEELRRRPPTPSLEPTLPTSRKRGWVPSNSEPSIPATVQTTIQTSTSGYIDPNTVYQGDARFESDEQLQRDEMVGGESLRRCKINESDIVWSGATKRADATVCARWLDEYCGF